MVKLDSKCKNAKISLPHWLTLALLTILAYFLYSDLLGNSHLYIFQERDIARSQMLLSGHSIFFGPETTGGANLPGSFYYVLLAISQYFQPGIEGAWHLQIVLFCLSSALLFSLLSRLFGPLAACTTTVLYIFSTVTYNLMSLFLNISSAFLFSILLLYTIYWYHFNKSGRPKTLNAFLIGGAAALSNQFHYSISLIYLVWLINLIFFGFAKKIDRSLVLQSFLVSLLGYALVASPYLLDSWLHFGDQRPPLNLVNNFNSGIILHKIFSENILSASSFLYESSIRIVLVLMPIPAALLWVINKKNKPELPIFFIRLLLCLIFLSAIFTIFVPIGHRYLIPSMLAIALFFSHYAAQSFNKIKLKIIFSAALITSVLAIFIYVNRVNAGVTTGRNTPNSAFTHLLAIFTFIPLYLFQYKNVETKDKINFYSNLLLAILSISGPYALTAVMPSTMSRIQLPTVNDWTEISLRVKQSTNWGIEKLINSTYYIGLHLEATPGPIASDIFSVKSEGEAATMIDGVIIGKLKAETRALPLKNIISRLANTNIPLEVRQALQSNDFSIVKSEMSNSYLLIYYKKSKNIPIFNNYAYAYLTPTSHGKFKSEKTFEWNICRQKNDNQECFIRFHVDTSPVSKQNTRINVVIEGHVLSQRSEWVYPGLTANLTSPFLSLSCNGRTSEYVLADSVGYNRQFDIKSSGMVYGNNSLLAPMARDTTINCPVKNLKILGAGAKAFNYLDRVDQYSDSLPFLTSAP